MFSNRAQNQRDSGRNERPVRRARRWVKLVGGTVVLVLIWAFLMPPALGGGTSLMVTRGQSMEPLLHANDLAVVRKQSTYKVGDVVMYHSPTLNVKTLHRITAIDANNAVTTKGDNNTWLDEDHPIFDKIDGKMISHVDGFGRYILLMHTAGAMAAGAFLVIGALAWAIYAGRRNESNDEAPVETASAATDSDSAPREEGRAKRIPFDGKWVSAVAAGSTIVLVTLFTGFVAFTTPTTIQPGKTMYDLKGSFGYSAQASGENVHLVYADDQVSTGDPIYQNLVDQMLVTFDFHVSSPAKYVGGGTLGMKMEVTGQSGWAHTVKLVEPANFDGGHHRIAAVISLRQVSTMVKDVSALTKVTDKSYSVSFKPEVKLDGSIGGTNFNEGFTPSFALTGNDLQLKLDTANTSPAAAQPKGAEAVATGSMKGLTPSRSGTFTLEGGGATKWGPMPIGLLRILSVLGFLIGAGILAGAFWVLHRAGHDNENNDDALNSDEDFAHLIVPITGIAQAGTLATIVDLPTLTALANVAKRNDALILHELANEAENYLVNAAGTTYRFTHKTQASGTTRPRFGVADTATLDVSP